MINLEYVNSEQARGLEFLGYPSITIGREETYPTIALALKWCYNISKIGLNITFEYYSNGINVNWQATWPTTQLEWLYAEGNTYPEKHSLSNGSYMYGDNGEYPTLEDAESAGLDWILSKIAYGIHGTSCPIYNKAKWRDQGD